MLTDAEARALGERWIAAGGGWAPGMLVTGPDPAGSGWWWTKRVETMINGEPVGLPGPPAWPVLRDAATKGACLAIVRERWGFDDVSPRRLSVAPANAPRGQWWGELPGTVHGWGFFRGNCAKMSDLERRVGVVASEAEALVAALEAAPKAQP